ncbi:hypothetical protein SB768_32840, partial [Burkholderia sp. SIMBA_043]
ASQGIQGITMQMGNSSSSSNNSSMSSGSNDGGLSWMGIQSINNYQNNLSYLDNAVQNDPAARSVGEFEKGLFIALPVALATGGAG